MAKNAKKKPTKVSQPAASKAPTARDRLQAFKAASAGLLKAIKVQGRCVEYEMNNPAVSTRLFFAGNEDEASQFLGSTVGLDLSATRKVLEKLEKHPKISHLSLGVSYLPSVSASVFSQGPYECYWPQANLLFIATSMSKAQLLKAVRPLEPMEVFQSGEEWDEFPKWKWRDTRQKSLPALGEGQTGFCLFFMD